MLSDNQHPSENFQNALKVIFARVVEAGKLESGKLEIKDYHEMIKAVKIGVEEGFSVDIF